jgi:hypothetical protein
VTGVQGDTGHSREQEGDEGGDAPGDAFDPRVHGLKI